MGYKCYLERDIMKDLKLECDNKIKGRRYKANMIARRKADLVKLIMKRSAMPHDTKISEKEYMRR